MVRIPTLIVAAGLVAAATAAIALAGGDVLPNIGPPKLTAEPVYRGFYDGHIDTYMITDVSNKGQARDMHINYAPAIGKIGDLPDQYFVRGRAADGQLTVFDTEPGEDDYNPLWDEVWVTWKPDVKPVLLTQDDQIEELADHGKLTITDAGVVLNAPILTVGKSELATRWLVTRWHRP
jgi:hypothetical protein